MNPMYRFGNAALLLLALAANGRSQEVLRYHGAEFDLPAGWTSEANEDIVLIKPAGWKRDEVSGEAYGLLFDPETKSLDAEDLDEIVDGAAEEIVAGLQRRAAPTAGKVGTFVSKAYRYSGTTDAGKQVVMTIHVFAVKDGCVALFTMGFTEKMASRDKEIQALLGSARNEGERKPRRAFGLGKTKPAAEPGDQPASEPSPGQDQAKPDRGSAPSTGDASEPAAAKPEFVRIPGARELAWNGLLVDVPKDWQVQAGDDGSQLLLPPGFGASGVLEELFALVGDGSLRSLDGRDVQQRLQETLDEVQPGLRPKGQPSEAKFGALRGKVFTFTGSTPDGAGVEARVYAFPTGNGVGGLLALGYPQKLQARAKLVEAMLQSLRPAPAAAAGSVPAELAGQWVFYVGTTANNGGGSSRQKVLTLRADGSYSFVAENVSTNPNGAAWGDRNDSGRWSADATSITFRSQAGGTTTFALQKRNHPRNRDPMLVIGGDEFVTATQRRPW